MDKYGGPEYSNKPDNLFPTKKILLFMLPKTKPSLIKVLLTHWLARAMFYCRTRRRTYIVHRIPILLLDDFTIKPGTKHSEKASATLTVIWVLIIDPAFAERFVETKETLGRNQNKRRPSLLKHSGYVPCEALVAYRHPYQPRGAIILPRRVSFPSLILWAI